MGTATVGRIAPVPPSRIEGGKTCRDCRWFCSRVVHQGGEIGQCRKGPPVVYFHSGLSVSSADWPSVDSVEWCGALEPRAS